MYICIGLKIINHVERDKPTSKEIRKAKLESINQKNVKWRIVYKWKVDRESEDEKIEDLHLFCISIVKDLLYNRFFTNENGKMTYENMKDRYDGTLEDLENLFDIIYEKKLERDSSNR